MTPRNTAPDRLLIEWSPPKTKRARKVIAPLVPHLGAVTADKQRNWPCTVSPRPKGVDPPNGSSTMSHVRGNPDLEDKHQLVLGPVGGPHAAIVLVPDTEVLQFREHRFAGGKKLPMWRQSMQTNAIAPSRDLYRTLSHRQHQNFGADPGGRCARYRGSSIELIVSQFEFCPLTASRHPTNSMVCCKAALEPT